MSGIDRLLEVMAQLRDPQGGCPWDREQTFASIAPYTIEEAYEVADAIARNEPDALVDELGDLLFQVVFHAQMASESDWFGFDDVVDAIVDKMQRRHPHVFGDAQVADATEQTREWEAQKAAERRAQARTAGTPNSALSELDGVPVGLAALVRARKLQSRAARVGFDWSHSDAVMGKVVEELDELREAMTGPRDREAVEAELGDLLFSCVNLARHLGIDADGALRRANLKFEDRFRDMEERCEHGQRTLEGCTVEELDVLWNQAKTRRP